MISPDLGSRRAQSSDPEFTESSVYLCELCGLRRFGRLKALSLPKGSVFSVAKKDWS
jgi:hypothetical protein